MRILIKVFVREFYIANSSFFLLVIAFAGGFMRSYDHIVLAEFFISSPLILSIPFVIWLLYAFKVMDHNFELMKRNENEFIFCFSLRPIREQGSMLTRIMLLQLIPVILYALFLCLMAWKHSMLISVFLILVALFILVGVTTFIFLRALLYPNKERKVSALTRWINTLYSKPYPYFFIEWITRRELLMLIGTKIFSGLTLIAVTQLYKTDKYDLRLLGLGIVIAFTANVNLVIAMHRFENYYIGWIKGLPIGFLRKVLFFLVTLAILLLPEIGIMIKNFPSGFFISDQIVSMVFGFSIPILFYGILYIKDRSQEHFIRLVFCICIGWVFLILFKVPLYFLSIVNLSLGLLLWNKYYYLFEYISMDEGN